MSPERPLKSHRCWLITSSGGGSRSVASYLRLIVVIVIAVVAPAVLRAESVARHPLDPPDRSSPRAALLSFTERTDRLFAVFQQQQPAAGRVIVMRQAIAGILTCLDLREVAPSLQDSQGRQAAVCLKEVLDRIELPPLAEIPDADEVEREKLVRWRLPRTELALIRLADGDWVFSGDTVERAEAFFRRVQDVPYRRDAGSPGLHDFYVHAAGWMIPQALLQALPGWARPTVLGEAVWRWLALAVLLGGGGFVVIGFYRLAARAVRRGGFCAHMLTCAAPASLVLVTLAADYLLTYQIRFTGQPLFVMKAGLRITAFGGGILLLLAVLQRAADLVIHARGFRPGTIGTQLVRLGFKLLTAVAVAWMVIVGADYLGISVAPLLAGFGVGGLAVALAAQHTFENVLAGIMLFADAPVRIGDVCQFGDLRGTVEQIGLRSTRIRSSDRALISIPNAEFAKFKLVNFSRRDRIPLKIPLALRYETTGDQLRSVLATLRDVLKGHPRLVAETARARFIGYGSRSLDIELYALAETSDDGEFLAIQEDLLLRVMDVVLDAGCGFAFLDTRDNAAEAQVCPLRPGGEQTLSKAA